MKLSTAKRFAAICLLFFGLVAVLISFLNPAAILMAIPGGGAIYGGIRLLVTTKTSP